MCQIYCIIKARLKKQTLNNYAKKKKKIPITRDINKEKKKVHNSRRTYIKGGEGKKKKKTTKELKTTFFDVFLGFTKMTSF